VARNYPAGVVQVVFDGARRDESKGLSGSALLAKHGCEGARFSAEQRASSLLARGPAPFGESRVSFTFLAY
jgi:hypothetical protein